MDRKEKKLQEEMEKLAANYEKEIQDSVLHVFTNIVKKGAKPCEALGVSKSKMEGIYAQAYQLYNAGNFEKAFKTFEMLSLLNYDDPRFLFGMAASMQSLKRYKQAFQYFLLAANADQESPVPYYHAADCCLQEKDKMTALVMCQLVEDKSKDKVEYSYIKERSRVLKEQLTKELNAEGEQIVEALKKNKSG